jgi:glycosyltransferase involved in cell wall biosynthesis
LTALSIAHVLPSFHVGGQERVALDLARTQLGQGHRVSAFSIMAGAEGPLAEDFRAAGIPTWAVTKGPRVDPTQPLRLAARLRRAGVDVVHTHNPMALIYGAPAGKLARAIVVHTKHGANEERDRRVLLRRAAGRLCDAFVAVSRITAEQARAARDVAERKLSIIPNGIDLGRFGPDPRARAEVRAELTIEADAWVVGMVARADDAVKNQSLLLAALAPALGRARRLVFCGDGPSVGDLARKAGQLGVASWVHLLGGRKDVPRVLAALDVFALSSRTEGLPLVLPEAMATGLPIVATAVGGIPDVIDEGETGFLVPSQDEAALRARLAELDADRERARTLGARARAVALERYSLARMSEAYLALYRRLRAG